MTLSMPPDRTDGVGPVYWIISPAPTGSLI